MGEKPIPALMGQLALPVMIALLIQAVYNIVDSYFIAQNSIEGLTALSIIYPLQLLLTALSTGTGVGMNLLISRMDGQQRRGTEDIMLSGLVAELCNALVMTVGGLLILHAYYTLSTDNPVVQQCGIQYARIILLFCVGLFIESGATKILQSRGDMVVPMLAQVAGALTNLVLDPLLIFGHFGLPRLGITGAAIATIIGQWLAMIIVLVRVLQKYPVFHGRIRLSCVAAIYQNGLSAMAMQSLCTVYIIGMNLILKQFSDAAVTILGIYYKLQTFFFIPMFGLQQAIVPMISYNAGAGKFPRVHEILRLAMGISFFIMAFGTAIFLLIPGTLLRIFTTDTALLTDGIPALRIIGSSFLPSAVALILAVFFQGVNARAQSLTLIVLRQLVLLVPLAWLLHYFGLIWVWATFPLTEGVVMMLGICFYLSWRKKQSGADVFQTAPRR